MASTQVLRKQEHLEAGKRRLEEFRKKKAAEQAKKSASANQNHTSDIRPHQKQPLETGPEQRTDSDGAGTSDRSGQAAKGPSASATGNENKGFGFSIKSEQDFLNNAHASPSISVKYSNAHSADNTQTDVDSKNFMRYDASKFAGSMDVNNSHETEDLNNDGGIYTEVRGKHPIETTNEQSRFYGANGSQPTENSISLMQSSVTNPRYSHISTSKVSPQNSGVTLSQFNPSNASMLMSSQTASFYEDSFQPTIDVRGSASEAGQRMNGIAEINHSMISDYEERKFSSFASSFPSVNNAAPQVLEATGFNSDARGPSGHVPVVSVATETNARRSRPSFLDSLNVPRASSGTLSQHTEAQDSFMSNNSNTYGMDFSGSSVFKKPSVETESMAPFSNLKFPNGPSVYDQSMNSSFYFGNGGDLARLSSNENRMDKKHEFYSTKQNEDFAALEQHIEDLTQEKFTLQRALEASRALAESLATENSSLTDSYNQQRSVVNQLKSDMEKLQEEIKAQLVELEAVKIEYANAQLECGAADERSKLLASEVIGLEEKALRLRSSELKLERQLENSQAEISSFKRKMLSLEKERQDLQSTIDALQEEKKLLQSKLWKASTSSKPVNFSSTPLNKRDTSTSTEDLEASIPETQQTASSLESDASSLPVLPENGQSTLQVSSVNIPPDQMRMIQNINALISELALEKEELTQALASESSHCSQLKEINKDLSRKLEAQTQRLELLTAQIMANENIPARQPDSRTMQENTPLADEGDEVVERVLGWIMKLFPGGPSRRRTSKLL